MTTRKRGQPKGKGRRTKRRKSLTGRVARIAGTLISRHPSLAGGTAAFVVIFSFVSANAVWYQHGSHPAPLLSTRERPNAMPKVSLAAAATKARASSLTIAGLIGSAPASASAPGSSDQPADARQTASIPTPTARASRPGADPLVLSIQKDLAERQFYHGPLDGHDSPATHAAIEAFQAATASRITGEPSAELLAAIEATHRDAIAIPRSRPGDQPPAADDEIAAIAAGSASADVPAPIPAPAAVQPASTAKQPTNLVARIQTGLRNIAYSSVAVDGVAGAQTKAAIRDFEKNYRLPQNGEPTQKVLDKLIAIGAL